MAIISSKSGGVPLIESVQPGAALPGGEIAIHGSGFGGNRIRPRVHFGESEGSLVIASENFLIARVPDDAAAASVQIQLGGAKSQAYPFALGSEIADNLHPVSNPAVDAEGNVYVTYSGQRGQKVPVSLYKVTPSGAVKPFVTELMNPTGIALDHAGNLFVTCRNDGTVHRVTPEGRSARWVEGMGIATGIAFDKDSNLYVGDRSGTIFKINSDRQIFVFATLEPSVAAYHLAFNSAGDLFVTGPTQSSYDRVYRITPAGEVSDFFRGLGRPQGLAFDARGNLHVAACFAGQRGIVRISPAGEALLAVSGSNIVGLALLPSRRAMITTTGALFRLDWDVEGKPLFG
ncbi:MAG: IPT/TIG domain-containing protein [Candidatus Acidiferrales bacterium]